MSRLEESHLFWRGCRRGLAVPVLVLCLCGVGELPGQSPSQLGGGGGSEQGGGDGATAGRDGGRGVDLQGGSKFLGSDVPFFNPGDDVVTWDGRNWQVTNNRIFQARFEKFLNAPEADSEEDRAYRQTIQEIIDLLAPGRVSNASIDAAFRLLPQASNYPLDANLCDTIADAVYSVWLSQRERERLAAANAALDKELTRHEWNARMAAQDVTAKMRPGGEEGQNTNKGSEALARDLRVEPYLRRKVEVLALIEANKVKREASSLQVKVEFQAMIVQMFLQRRFQHVLIATRFYRALFGDGDTLLRVEGDAKELFARTTGLPPTVGILDTMANELIRDAGEGVDAFLFLLEKGELESATKRLGEAFVIGEYLPALRTLDREKKRLALQFTQRANQLLSALEVKDYALAEELVSELRSSARDFDTSKALAAIETARTVSAMHLAKAKNAAVSGDRETLEAELRAATEIWPRNPALAEVSGVIFTQSDTQMQALNDLERLISQRNYRQIYEDQVRFIAATALYPDRQEALRQVLVNVQKIETAMIKAREMARHGDVAGAWEQVERAHGEFPDDNQLNQLRAELTTQAASFVSTLRKAEELENKGFVGSSLAWFLKARQIYPNSIFAREGIDRLIPIVLPDARKDMEPAKNEEDGL